MNRYSFIQKEDEPKPETKMVYFYTDGSSWPRNPGNGGFGIYACEGDGSPVMSIATSIDGEVTNNQMEYLGMLMALRILRSETIRSRFNKAKMFSDSKILIDTIKNQSFDPSKKNGILTELRRMILTEIDRSPMSIEFEWIEREGNQIADELSKRGSQGQNYIDGLGIDPEDFAISSTGHLDDARDIQVRPRNRRHFEDNLDWRNNW